MRTALALLPVIALSATAFAEPATLFDGKSLDGWDYDPKVWRVEDGMITGGSTTEKIRENHFICTKKSYQNFDLKLKIKCSGDPKTGMINSGIQIRSVRVPGGAHMSGYQVDCGAGWFGKIYDEFRRNKVIAEPVDAEALAKVVDVFGWNEYHIRAEGPRIQAWINGVLAIDYTETDKNIPLDGQIGPQVHSGGMCLVQFKDVTIEELPPTPGAPTWESLGGVQGVRKLVAPPPKAAANPQSKRDISYNDVQGAARTAQEQKKLFHLPDGFDIELVVQESEGLGKFISVYFDQRGRMWTQTALEYPVDANENPAAAEALYQSRGKDKVLVYPRESLNAPLPPGGLTDPTVFADGLAIPLGLLPWGNGDSAYVLHGHDILLLTDTNGDGAADERKVVLTGLGVQDSHLFPHQFTRAPGGWIWMAQGLFNNSKVRPPGSDESTAVDWPKCSMARMRPDGSQFEVTSTGPNNIWGLVITGEGEAFIQEANDYGYPVMPFHEYAYYPGGMEPLRKSYQPEFPPTAEFRMGGTGLSGLALGEGAFRKLTPTLKNDGLCMFVANPIISKIQTIAMDRDGPYWKLEQAADLITCDDPFFRPVAMTQGPDGSLYIVDWYNKIISHNEVPRNHPDRDRTRGRIWRVKRSTVVPASAGKSARPTTDPAEAGTTMPLSIPDFTKLGTDDLIALLGTQPTARAHLAWQTLADRSMEGAGERLYQTVRDTSAFVPQRIQALWVLNSANPQSWRAAFGSTSRNLRREGVRMAGDVTYQIERGLAAKYGPGGRSVQLADGLLGLLTIAGRDLDPEIRAEYLRQLARNITHDPKDVLPILLSLVQIQLPGPTAPSSRSPKQIPVREAYDREFERFLVRMFLERRPDVVAKFLDSEAASKLPTEALVLASLALEPKSSAPRVAKLLPQLDRAPNEEELLRLAQYPDEPGVADALSALLTNEKSRAPVAEKLLAQRTKLDAAKIAPLLTTAARTMLGSADVSLQSLALQLIGGFQLTALEPELVTNLAPNAKAGSSRVPLLNALRDLHSSNTELFANLVKSESDTAVRDAALEALAASRAPDAASHLFDLFPTLSPAQHRTSLSAISSTKAGAKAIVAALEDKKLPSSELDASTVDRLATVLAGDPALKAFEELMGGAFRPVLALDGQDTAWVDSRLTLDGPFTIECWVRLAPGISNEDSLLGSTGQLDLNFFQSKFRVWAGSALHDVAVAKKPITPDLWTHIAVTRDAKGIFRIYQNGELDAVATKPAPQKFENCNIGWSGPKKGTEGMMAEFQVWQGDLGPQAIRANFDRAVDCKHDAGTLIYPTGKLDKLGKGARIARVIDYPPVLTEEQARTLDAKFTRYSKAASHPGNLENGKLLSAICLACHQIGNAGGQIGPNLSGAGAMGLEGVLRNILTPNAAMESGYRIFRVELNSGDLVDALYVSEDKDAYIVRQPGFPDRRIARADVRSTRYIRRSLMPEGLLDPLSDDQVRDLLGYLMSLK